MILNGKGHIQWRISPIRYYGNYFEYLVSYLLILHEVMEVVPNGLKVWSKAKTNIIQA